MVVIVAPSVAFGYVGGSKQPFFFHKYKRVYMLLQIYVNNAFSNLIIIKYFKKKVKYFSKPLASFRGERGIIDKTVRILGSIVIKCTIYTKKTANRSITYVICNRLIYNRVDRFGRHNS